MRKLKIGVVVDQLLAGGVQLSAIEYVKGMNRLGHQAKLLILMKKKYSTDFSYLVKDVPHQYLSDSYPPPFRKTIKLPIFSFLSTLHLMSPILAPGVIKKGDYDILVSLGTTTCLTTQAIFHRHQLPYIAVIHDPIIYILETVYAKTFLRFTFPIIKPLAKYFERSFVKDAKETVIISQVHFDYLLQNYGVRPHILGLSTPILDQLPKKRGGYLLSFGRWQKEKHPEFLLELMETLPKARLIMAGTWTSPDELEHFRRQIKDKGLDNRVKVVSHYSGVELVKLASQARVWLYPHFEAFGLAALEAASFGLPIIIQERSGVTESFRHGIHGYFPSQLTIASYREYASRLLTDERLAYRMGKMAAKLVKANFSAEAISQSLLRIINSALKLDQPTRMVVLEMGHAPGSTLAGGDKLMEPMAVSLGDRYLLDVVVPEIGAKHWQLSGLNLKLKILAKNRFDESASPVPIFLTYLVRMYQAYKYLRVGQSNGFIYSSTNILPDVLPAYLAKKRAANIVWIARIHHLIPAPHQREGRLIVNVVAYIMQMISLAMIKRSADIILVLNGRLEKALVDKGFGRQRMKVLGAGIDYGRISSQKVMPKSRSFDGVYLGRLHPAKGIFDLVPIWERVIKDNPEATLAVIGGGGGTVISKRLKELIKNRQLSRNIFLLGALPDGQVYSVMKQSRVFLFTDHEAGWGIAVAEAMACGLAVVGFDNGVLGSVFKNGYVKVAFGDFDQFGSEIGRLLNNSKRRLELAAAGQRESKSLDWSQTSLKFRQILAQLAAPGSK